MVAPIGGLFRGIARGIQGQTEQAREQAHRKRAEEMALFTSLLGADEEDEPAVRAFAAARGLNLPAIQREAPVEYDVPGLGRMPLRRRDLTRFAPFFQMANQREIADIKAASQTALENLKAAHSLERLTTNNEHKAALATLSRDLTDKIRTMEEQGRNLRAEERLVLQRQIDEANRKLEWAIAQMRDITTRRGQDVNITIAGINQAGRAARNRTDLGKEDQAMWAGAWDDASAIIARDPKAATLSAEEQTDLQERLANRLFEQRKQKRGRVPQRTGQLPIVNNAEQQYLQGHVQKKTPWRQIEAELRAAGNGPAEITDAKRKWSNFGGKEEVVPVTPSQRTVVDPRRSQYYRP